MMRGIFDFMQKQESYTRSKKDWLVSLTESTHIWYDLLHRPPEEIDTKQLIKDYVKQYQALNERQLNKRFIYFLASRTKVRFCTSKKPRYSVFGKNLILYIEIGQRKLRKKVITRFLDATTGQPIQPPIKITDRFINQVIKQNIYFALSRHRQRANCKNNLQPAWLRIPELS